MATIMLFAGDFAPKYWAFCNGALLSIAQNSALFSLLGTTYGGDGRTTFGLPDFRGRAAVGTGPNYTLGQVSGNPSVTLNTSNLAPHTHTVNAVLTATSAAPNTDEGPNSILAGANIYAAGNNGQLAGVTAAPSSVSGSNTPVNVMQPYLGMNFVICTQGVYPSRN